MIFCYMHRSVLYSVTNREASLGSKWEQMQIPTGINCRRESLNEMAPSKPSSSNSRYLVKEEAGRVQKTEGMEDNMRTRPSKST